jgi:hypothetical protein
MATMETKLCECGCGTVIPVIGSRGQPLRFVKSHSLKIQHYVLPKEKKCNSCKQFLSISSFGLRNEKRLATMVQRPRSKCKKCEAALETERMNRPGERAKKWTGRKQKRASHIRYKLQDKIAAWRKKTLDSDLTVDYLVELWETQQGKCYYTGCEMEWCAKSIEKHGMSLDRLDPKAGYRKGNVVFCCYFVNTMKGSHTEQEFYEMMNHIISHRGHKK